MEKKTIKYGGFIALGLIAYFLIVRLLGMHENYWLRLLNGVIVAFGIYNREFDVRKQITKCKVY